VSNPDAVAKALAELLWEISSLCVQLRDRQVQLPEELLTSIGRAVQAIRVNGHQHLLDEIETVHREVWG
jgi:hypothetical protein